VVQVIRDIFDNRRDPVRAGGFDDPGGGVLDQAPDVYGFRDPFAPAAVPAQARAEAAKADADAEAKAKTEGGESAEEAGSESEPDDQKAIEVVELEEAAEPTAEGSAGGGRTAPPDISA
jgi:hypothetical protein